MSPLTLRTFAGELHRDPVLGPLLGTVGENTPVVLRVGAARGAGELTVGELTTRWRLATLLR